MCGAFKDHLLTESSRKRCENPACCSPKNCLESSKNAAFPISEAASLLNKESLIYKVVLICENLVDLFPLKTSQLYHLFFFWLFKTLPCASRGFYQVTRKQIILCLQQSKHAQKNFIAKDKGKIALSCLSASYPRYWFFP